MAIVPNLAKLAHFFEAFEKRILIRTFFFLLLFSKAFYLGASSNESSIVVPGVQWVQRVDIVFNLVALFIFLKVWALPHWVNHIQCIQIMLFFHIENFISFHLIFIFIIQYTLVNL